MILEPVLSSVLRPVLASALDAPAAGDGLTAAVAALFASKEGYMWDFTKPSNLFQTSAGATAVSSDGDPIGYVTDLSGKGHHGIQAAGGTTRPLFRTRGGNGARIDGSAQRMYSATAVNLSTATLVTIIVAQQRRRDLGAQTLIGHGASITATNGTFNVYSLGDVIGKWGIGLRGTGSTFRYSTTARPAQQASVYSAVLDIQGANAAARFKTIRVNNVADTLGGELGTFANVGPINFSSQVAYLGAVNDSTTEITMGDVFRVFVIEGELSAADYALAYAWVAASLPAVPTPKITVLGDSTIAGYLGCFDVPYYIDNLAANDLAVPGDTINGQLSRWNNAGTDRTSPQAVVIEVGLNDLSDGGETAATVIARLQAMVDDINVDTAVPIIIAQMTPCRGTGGRDYPKWLAVNEAIAGLGATPITGVDQRVTAHVPLLDDGSGFLRAEYSIDGVHENNAGRQIVAAAWTTALRAAGIIP